MPALAQLECVTWGPLDFRHRSNRSMSEETWRRFVDILQASAIAELGFDGGTLSRDADDRRMSRMRIEGDRETMCETVELLAKAFGPITAVANPRGIRTRELVRIVGLKSTR